MFRIVSLVCLVLFRLIVVAQSDHEKKKELKEMSVINASIVTHYDSQKKNFHYNVESQGGVTSEKAVPFWLRSNQYGSVPLSGPSFGLIAGVSKTYDTTKKFFHYGFGFQGRFNAGRSTQFSLLEGYAKIKLSVFELKVGRSKEFTGLVDSTLSSGAFAISGNALGIPKLQLSIPEYVVVPLTLKLLSIKGGFSHGWLGRYEIYFRGNENVITYFHQKYLYAKIGRPHWRFHAFGGFNHQVFWGNEETVYGARWTQSLFDTYTNVVFGRTTRLEKVEKSKVGNALGSIDLGAEYAFKRFKIFAYHQFFYDVGALYYLANVKDGLTGLSVTNTIKNKKVRMNKVLVEYFYSVDQAGYPWSKRTPSGDEDYYNNYYYIKGWSYQQAGLGNPLITSREFAQKGFPVSKADYFINNRVTAIHMGLDMNINKVNLILKATASNNLGTFSTSPFGSSLGPRFNKPVGKFKESKQYSFYLEGQKPLKNKFYVGTAVAFDFGDLLNNSAGVILKVGRSL